MRGIRSFWQAAILGRNSRLDIRDLHRKHERLLTIFQLSSVSKAPMVLIPRLVRSDEHTLA